LRRFLVRGACHFVRQVDADDIARLPDQFGGRKEHRSAAACDIEHTLPGLNAGDRNEAPTEMCEAAWARRVIIGHECIELRSGLGLAACLIIAYVYPSQWQPVCTFCLTLALWV
jgi:hypothetical protein